MLYLHEKDEDTYTGLEQYVWDLINSTNIRDQIRWFPMGKALSLEARREDDDGQEEEDGNEDEGEDEEQDDDDDDEEEEEEEEEE